jgi:hypothetical protein
MLNAGRVAQKNLNPADPVVGPRAKSDHEPHEKLCPLLIVVHLSAVNVVHVSFQFQRGGGSVHAATNGFRMLPSGKRLRHFGDFEVREQRSSAALVPDKLLTLLSILCQRRSGRAKAAVLRFVWSRQVFSAQAVTLAPIELAPCRDPAGMEGGMQRRPGTLVTDGDVLVPVLAG